MKSFSISCLLSLCSVLLFSAPSFAEKEALLELVEQADVALCFDEAVYVDIGIARQINGKREPILFAPAHLVDFLKKERRKELLLACFPEHLNSNSKTEARKFLRSLKFNRVVECTLAPEIVFSTRTNAKRKFPENEPESRYIRTRVFTVGQKLDIGFGFIDRKESDNKQPYEVWIPIGLDREELLSFLKQDSQKNMLEVHWSKFASKEKINEESVKAMADASHFSAVTFKEDRSFFPGNPVELDSSYNKFLARADVVLCFYGPNKIDIGIARIRNGKRVPKLFTQDELTEFFAKETRKELVTAFISKAAGEREDIERFLSNLRYRQVIRRDGIPEDVYSKRAHWSRELPSVENPRIEFERIRQMRIEGPDVFSIRIGIKDPNEPSPLFLSPNEHTIFLTQEELGEFLKQDTQKQLLRIHESKYENGVDQHSFETFVKKCGFPFAEFVPDVSMFQVEPIKGPH